MIKKTCIISNLIRESKRRCFWDGTGKRTIAKTNFTRTMSRSSLPSLAGVATHVLDSFFLDTHIKRMKTIN